MISLKSKKIQMLSNPKSKNVQVTLICPNLRRAIQANNSRCFFRSEPMKTHISLITLLAAVTLNSATAEDKQAATLRRAFINGDGPDWKALSLQDFVNVNCADGTWSEKEGTIRCSGMPVGVTRSKKTYTNFELVVEWRHLKPAGNSGVFLWAVEKSFAGLKPGSLPSGGIEVQVLDLEYETRYEKQNGKKSDAFTSHGDVFPVGSSKMKPFPPVSPNGRRSRGSGEISWRAVDSRYGTRDRKHGVASVWLQWQARARPARRPTGQGD